MDALHVITEIPVAWEAISHDVSLATEIGAEEGLVAVSMHGVGLTLMSKKASS